MSGRYQPFLFYSSLSLMEFHWKSTVSTFHSILALSAFLFLRHSRHVLSSIHLHPLFCSSGLKYLSSRSCCKECQGKITLENEKKSEILRCFISKNHFSWFLSRYWLVLSSSLKFLVSSSSSLSLLFSPTESLLLLLNLMHVLFISLPCLFSSKEWFQSSIVPASFILSVHVFVSLDALCLSYGLMKERKSFYHALLWLKERRHCRKTKLWQKRCWRKTIKRRRIVVRIKGRKDRLG